MSNEWSIPLERYATATGVVASPAAAWPAVPYQNIGILRRSVATETANDRRRIEHVMPERELARLTSHQATSCLVSSTVSVTGTRICRTHTSAQKGN